ncbi:MAG: TolC family protein [bacterium]
MRDNLFKFCLFMPLIFLLSGYLFAVEITSGDVLTLDEAIRIALEGNREMQETIENLGISRNEVREARAAGGFNAAFQGGLRRVEDAVSFSMLSFQQTGYFYNSASPTTLDITTTPSAMPLLMPSLAQVQVSQKETRTLDFVITKPLYTFGKISGAVRISRLSHERSELEVRRVRLKVAQEVREAFYGTLLAQEAVHVAEEGSKQAQAHLDAARSRYDVGVTPRFDVIRSEVEVAKAQEELTTAKKGYELAGKYLNNLLGLPLDRKMRLVEPQPAEMIDCELDDCIMRALAERVELKQIEIGLEQTEIGGRISRMLPSFGLNVSYGVISEGSLFTLENAWTAMVMGEIPIYDSGSGAAGTAKAKATGKKLQATKARAEDGIRLQVEEVYLNLTEAKNRVETSEAILRQAEEAVKMAEIGYKEGVNPSIDLIDAQQALNGARINKAKAHYDYEVAKARLAYVIGFEPVH